MKFLHYYSRPKDKSSQEEPMAVSNPTNGKAMDTNTYQAKPELGKILLGIREAAISEGMRLKSLEEIEKD